MFGWRATHVFRRPSHQRQTRHACDASRNGFSLEDERRTRDDEIDGCQLDHPSNLYLFVSQAMAEHDAAANAAAGGGQGSRKEIYTYKAPWTVFAMSWSRR